MALEVAELKDSPECNNSVDDPRWVGVSAGEEIKFNRVKEGEKDPVMDAVDEDSFEGHGVSAENVYERSLVLSFGVMQQGHYQSPALDVCVLFFVAEEVKDGEDEERSEVLDVEHVVPSDLLAEVLEGQLVVGGQVGSGKGELVVREDHFFIVGLEGDFLLGEGEFG